MKGSLLFILGAAVGIISCMLSDSPINPFHSEIEARECQTYYAKKLNITEAEFVQRIEQMQVNP